MTTPEVSHGRGGAGNIEPDDTKYVDGEIVRAGVEGSHNDGPFSTGRGGTGNIGDVGLRRSVERADAPVVPEAAVRPSTDLSDYHTGRGGAGNEHLAPGHDKTKAGTAKPADDKGKVAGSAAPGAAATAAAAAAPTTNGHHVDNPMGLADKLKHKLAHVLKR
ncbi:hypothetical protein SPI_05007 [Niveomyces insectorum RCEF 264]|uniref:Uncharacterized protein n=1 Tax=Niveomyces insectorum RCEF 264 TaxID=1081102 RepID=A0A167TV66_9HYPO|nr:hypothetical protein SPI_05007 [Niveomyces insectorum RCEF 264]